MQNAIENLFEEPKTQGKTYRDYVLDASATVSTWNELAQQVYKATGKPRTGETNRAIRDTLCDCVKRLDIVQVGYNAAGDTLYIRCDKALEFLTGA